MIGGKLIGEGSRTCVFNPNLPCKKINNIDKNTISKLFLKKQKDINKEISFNKKISKLKNSDIWSVPLYNKCYSLDYETILQYDNDIKTCLDNNDTSINEFNNSKNLILYGDYGGISMKDKSTKYSPLINKHINNETTITDITSKLSNFDGKEDK